MTASAVLLVDFGVSSVSGAVFSGVLVNGVDAKGRVSVPHAFRMTSDQRLAEKGVADKAIRIGRHARWNCLEVLDAAEVAEVSAMIDRRAADRAEKTGEFFDDVREELRFEKWSELTEVSYDSAGRMVLPAALREEVGISEDAVFVGGETIFYIWSPEAFRAARPNASAVHRQIDDQIAAKRGGRA